MMVDISLMDQIPTFLHALRIDEVIDALHNDLFGLIFVGFSLTIVILVNIVSKLDKIDRQNRKIINDLQDAIEKTIRYEAADTRVKVEREAEKLSERFEIVEKAIGRK